MEEIEVNNCREYEDLLDFTGSTKTCPVCDNAHLVEISSQMVKYCTDCHVKLKWDLEENQKSLVSNNRIKNNC